MDIRFTDAFKETLPTAFHVMAKPIGPICNLKCKYCYYLEKENLYKNNKSFKMSDEVLEAYIKQMIEGQDVEEILFVWQGGEPTLMGLDFFQNAIEIQKKYSGKKKISNSFQTNGTLLTADWCRFFKKNNFLVGISIDGPAELHDKYRVYKNGNPSFHLVMKGIKLLKRFQVEFNTLTVVNNVNVRYPLEVYDFLKKIGSNFMQFIPIVERIADDPDADELALVAPEYAKKADISFWSVRPLQYGKFLSAIFDEWVLTDVGKYFVQIFDVTLANWVGAPPGLCVFGETCGHAMALEHNGDLYACDHFVYQENYVGNILENPIVRLIQMAEQKKFGYNKRDKLPVQCFKCEYRFTCHGECPKNRILKTAEGHEGLNYLCEGLKYFFKHVHPYMDFMAEELKHERPPANIMQWAANQKHP
ncbi:anaerobic sulfatase-maturation protein [Bacteroidota bacterium]